MILLQINQSNRIPRGSFLTHWWGEGEGGQGGHKFFQSNLEERNMIILMQRDALTRELNFEFKFR